MTRRIIILLYFLAVNSSFFAQNKDTISTEFSLEEIVISTNKNNKNKQLKPFASIDDYLLSSGKINMIRRGNYAWEPMLYNMGSERIYTTIDGMKIFCACTDSMNPVIS